jgi:hypothetical protein
MTEEKENATLSTATKQLKHGDIQSRTRDDLTATVWRDKFDMCTENIHSPPAAEGNFCDEHRNCLKPQIVQDYNQHMGHVHKGDEMANIYSL